MNFYDEIPAFIHYFQEILGLCNLSLHTEESQGKQNGRNS